MLLWPNMSVGMFSQVATRRIVSKVGLCIIEKRFPPKKERLFLLPYKSTPFVERVSNSFPSRVLDKGSSNFCPRAFSFCDLNLKPYQNCSRRHFDICGFFFFFFFGFFFLVFFFYVFWVFFPGIWHFM